jgi:excisionase family DNA binding protein
MTTAVAPPSAWVSINDAAEQLGVHPRTLRRYIKDGRLKVQRLSTQVVRIRPEDITAFKDENLLIKTGVGTCWVSEPRQAEHFGATGARPTGSLPA